MALTEKQRRFVEEYLVDLNATQASIRAGYSQKTAYSVGHENLSKPEIADAIAEAKAERSRRTQVTQDQVIRELARLGFSDLRKVMTKDGALLSPEEWDDDTAAAISSLEVVTVHKGDEDGEGRKVPERVHKIKVWDKNSALEKLGKHLGLYTDKLSIGGDPDNPIKTEEVGQGSAKLMAYLNGIAERSRDDSGASGE